MTALEYVGNDIVDLEEPVIADHHRRTRFVARICSADEQSRLNRSRNPKVLLWSLFAAKEAAFKLAVKRFGPLPFSPRAFEVAADRRSVRYERSRWFLQLEHGPVWVHALVSTAPLVASRVAPANAVLPSDAARMLLIEIGAKALSCSTSQLCVVRPAAPAHWDGLGPPQLLCAAKPTATDVSLSHDGRFVAAALVLRKNEAHASSEAR